MRTRHWTSRCSSTSRRETGKPSRKRAAVVELRTKFGVSERRACTVFDQTVVNGNLAFSGSTSLILSFFDNDPESTWASNIDWSDTFWDDDHSWTIYDVSGTTTGFTNLSLLQESWLDNADPTQQAFATIRPSASFSLVLFGNDVRLAYTVPEPSSIILAALAALAALGILSVCGLRRQRGRHTISD